MKNKHWYDYLWIWTILYFALGFFNILFAWLGMIDFLVPLVIALLEETKDSVISIVDADSFSISLEARVNVRGGKVAPKWLVSKGFRYGFLVFFLVMFGNIVFQTYLVGAGAKNLTEAIKLFWTIRVPWGWAYSAGTVADWIARFSFGFYSLMLTSTLIGLIVMVLFRPRTWCAFCPMGTMTQMICKIKSKEK